MARYATQTTVSSEASRGEIERILTRYGADQFMYGWDQESAVVGFRMQNRMVRFLLPMPSKGEFKYTPAKHLPRSPQDALAAWEQACRQRWRALALVVKAKLEAVDTGITTFEDEFLAHIMLPDGGTAGEWLRPQIATAYETGEMPKLLPLLASSGEETE